MTHKGTVVLETSRLILRRFTAGDAEVMFSNWASDSEVTKYLTWQPHKNVEATRELLSEWEKKYQNVQHYLWAIELKETGQLIGSISVVSQREDVCLVHIGYCIGKNWWHKGYTSEALLRLVEFFFDEIGVNRIESRHDPRNPNSGKVMQKAGFIYEGTMRQSDVNNQGGFCDAAYYAVLKSDYRKNLVN